jgi:hypothetical protein
MKTGKVAYTPMINLKISPENAAETSTDSQEQEVSNVMLINVSFLQMCHLKKKLFSWKTTSCINRFNLTV